MYFQCNWWSQILYQGAWGKLSIAVNHTSNPTSQTIWLEGRNYVIYEYENRSEWIYIFDWVLRIYIFDWVYCLCCKTSRFWMNLVRCASFRMSFLLLIDIQSSWADTWESQWILPSTMLDLNMKDTCFKRSMRRSTHMCVELTGWARPMSLSAWMFESYNTQRRSVYMCCIG